MKKSMRQACAEVDEILKYMPMEYLNRIPKKYIEFFHEARLPDYEVRINPDKPLADQKLVYETLVLLTILKLNFWCDNEEEKERLLAQLRENDEKKENQYDFEQLHEKAKEETAKAILNSEKKQIEVREQSWISKLFTKIKNIFRKK